MVNNFAVDICNSRKIKSLPKQLIVPRNEWNSYYSHYTLRIHSLSEYIEVIGRLTSVSKLYLYEPLVFRGHSDSSSNFQLIPTIGRKPLVMEYHENLMVNDMINLRPEEFDNLKTDFDLLSKLQHFGIPTRLLDFSFNPLIALYFACCEKPRTEGRVICTYDTSDESNMKYIELICGMYRHTDYHAISFDELIGGVSQIKRYTQKLLYPLFARPRYTNNRLKNQSAVFMVFPNAIYDRRSMMVEMGRKHGDEEDYRRFTITKEEEKRLKYVRNEEGIYLDESFYVDDYSIRRLFNYYSNKYNDFIGDSNGSIADKYHFILHNRFSIVNEIQEISEEQLSRLFFSILVDAKCKKRIIRELSTIGIDKAFVFPELEYTAAKIKDQYY